MSRLITAPWILPITQPPIPDAGVVVDASDTILAIGRRGNLLRLHPEATEERADGALLPALVNAHCHLELSALAGAVPGGGGLIAWATKLVGLVRALDPARAAMAATAGAAAMAAAGVGAVGDVGNSLTAVPAIGAAGLRGIFFHELVGSRDAREGGALADAGRELERFLGGSTPDGTAATDAGAATWPAGLAYVPAPHAPYSVGRELFRRIFHVAARAGVPTSVHVAEDLDELLLLRDGSGRWPAVLQRMGVDPATRVAGQPPVAYLASLGAFEAAQPPLLVHMVHADADDRRRARDAGATAVLCPRSNLHITGELPDVPALLADGVSLAIGTDSPASTPDLSPWGELATLAERFPQVAPATWLDAATRAGAEAMQLGPLGSLTPGKRPGIIEVVPRNTPTATSTPEMSLVSDPVPVVRWRART
jgi:cytosine/adenosine deaminase-related metal-dependent hydrolase